MVSITDTSPAQSRPSNILAIYILSGILGIAVVALLLATTNLFWSAGLIAGAVAWLFFLLFAREADNTTASGFEVIVVHAVAAISLLSSGLLWCLIWWGLSQLG